MNKLLIVLLAVCLVSVHAFVKRDAPAPAPTFDVAKQLEDIKASLANMTQSFVNEASKVLNPDAVKKQFEEVLEATKQVVEKLKIPKPEEAKPAA